jgi:carboxypeptidase Q
MARLKVGLGLVLATAACGGGSAPATTPAPAATPAAAVAPPTQQTPAAGAPAAGAPAGRGAAGGRGAGGGGRGGGAPSVDSTKYVRTAPPTDPIIQRMWTEGTTAGQAGKLAQVLMDSIGPRLVGSDRFNAGQEWLVKLYASWGVTAKREQYGTWNSWKRGTTHVDLIAPRVRSLEAMMLAWSPGTGGKDVIGDVVTLPAVRTPEEFAAWVPTAKGKFVLMNAPNPSCRSAAQWNEFGQIGAFDSLTALRRVTAQEWTQRTLAAGNQYEWPKAAGVAGVITTSWSQYPGVNKVFGSWRQQVPTLEASCEDYNLLFRLAQNNQGPKVKVNAESEFLGEQPVFNVIARIPGTEKPNDYIVLSAHYDSWDGASGATDNGTGTITMLEALRILKKHYPNPKRTIIVGHWGGEEQGLNGSRGWVEDNPAIVANVVAGWNQDNGTGRVTGMSPGPFVGAQERMISWMSEMPSQITGFVRLGGMSGPASGGTDNAAFQCAKSPVFGLNALSWDYSNSTWHTNRDTYDKIVVADLQNNANLVAMLTYLADKDPLLGKAQPTDSLTNPATGAKTPVTYSCPKGTRATSQSGR